MSTTEKETRARFRGIITNERATYERIQAEAVQLSASISAAVDLANTESASAAGAPLIVSDEGKAEAIAAYIDEVRELIEWELIGKHHATGPGLDRYDIARAGDIITVTDNLEGLAFRFRKGDKFAADTLTIIAPERPTTVEGLEAVQAAADTFCSWAAHRFPLEFGTD